MFVGVGAAERGEGIVREQFRERERVCWGVYRQRVKKAVIYRERGVGEWVPVEGQIWEGPTWSGLSDFR